MSELTTVSYAGFWKRLLAYLIDSVILTIGGFIIGFILGIFLGVMLVAADANTNAIGPYANGLGNVLGLILGWLYFSFLESSAKQGTIGKMALGIKVTDLAGNRISFGRATGRYFSKILSALILLIGFIMIAFTSRKQGLHDMIANCLVVNTDTTPPTSHTTQIQA